MITYNIRTRTISRREKILDNRFNISIPLPPAPPVPPVFLYDNLMFIGDYIAIVKTEGNRNLKFVGDYIAIVKTEDNGNLMMLGDYVTPANDVDNGNLMMLGDYIPVTPPTIIKVNDTIVMT